jgi:hypothetical protein
MEEQFEKFFEEFKDKYTDSKWSITHPNSSSQGWWAPIHACALEMFKIGYKLGQAKTGDRSAPED